MLNLQNFNNIQKFIIINFVLCFDQNYVLNKNKLSGAINCPEVLGVMPPPSPKHLKEPCISKTHF